MDEKATIDGLARRNAELQEQLEQMTANRATALDENERKRDLIQELQRELAGKNVTIHELQMKMGTVIHDAQAEKVEELRETSGLRVELTVGSLLRQQVLRAIEDEVLMESVSWTFEDCSIASVHHYGTKEGEGVVVRLYPEGELFNKGD
jgi:hypothetical protein